MPADSWPRCWSANRPSAASGAASWPGRMDADDTAHRASPPDRWVRVAMPSSPRARGRPCSQASRSTSSGSSRSSATPAPRSSAAPAAPSATRRIRSRSPPVSPRARSGTPGRGGQGRQRAPSRAGATVTTTRLGRLAEQVARGIGAHAQRQVRADARPQAHLRDGDREAAAAHVLGGPQQAGLRGVRQQAQERRMGGQVELRRPVVGSRARDARRRWSRPCRATAAPSSATISPAPPGSGSRRADRCRPAARRRRPGRWVRWRPRPPTRCRG